MGDHPSLPMVWFGFWITGNPPDLGIPFSGHGEMFAKMAPLWLVPSFHAIRHRPISTTAYQAHTLFSSNFNHPLKNKLPLWLLPESRQGELSTAEELPL